MVAPKDSLEIVLGWPTETGCHELVPKKVTYKWRLDSNFWRTNFLVSNFREERRRITPNFAHWSGSTLTENTLP